MRKKFKFNRVLAVVLVLESKGLYGLLRRLLPRVNSLKWVSWNCCHSLRSRRLEVVSERENGCARGRHATHFLREKPWEVDEVDAKGEGATSPLASPSRAPVFSCAHYFQAPATQAIAVKEVFVLGKNSFKTKIFICWMFSSTIGHAMSGNHVTINIFNEHYLGGRCIFPPRTKIFLTVRQK